MGGGGGVGGELEQNAMYTGYILLFTLYTLLHNIKIIVRTRFRSTAHSLIF